MNLMETFWYPNNEIIERLVSMCKNKNYTKILENGPGSSPFPLSTHFIDINPKIENTISIDIDFEKIPFEDNYFDFCYARHIFEDIQNPQYAFAETIRTCKNGYIETPSPLIECLRMVDGLSRQNNIQYCGYIHHRYIVWTDMDTNTLYFLPKYPLIEYLIYDPDIYNSMLELSKEKIYWNNYYVWNETNKPHIVVFRNGYNFDIVDDYTNLVIRAIDQSIKHTQRFIIE